MSSEIRKLIRSNFGSHPMSLKCLVHLGLMGRKDLLSRKDSEITIEGFPRSGNSYACGAFRYANPSVSRIATHLHVAGNVLLAVKNKIPCIVLLRDPRDAICSLGALEVEVRRREGQDCIITDLSLVRSAIDYSLFYTSIRSAIGKVLLNRFETLTSDFGSVIVKLNEMSGSAFIPFDSTAESQAAVREKSGFHALPNEMRQKIKRDIEIRVREPSRMLQTRLDKAIEVYKECYDLAF